ncbi:MULTISPECIES: hypothetical protein [Ruegeria]|uniref:hypothetical protein n=1 Tax=Ruegeria TaxID=97050 RepID=UPI001268B648|nr:MULTISPECIES: hypothetical protein [Ruegeria]NOD75944.1 hypothetical protein [Ruegeria sp. HKCCD4332]QFT72180.1 hypothetical protein FIU92_04005 [Ruegeria sp. THAF33]UWR03256.1 hypothetical protein K3740_00650 [Ruegeria conchae]
MTENKDRLTAEEAKGLRTAKELEGHLAWLDTFTPAALGVLAIASGIYTYLGVSSLLEDNGAVSFFAAVAYSIAVSVGIFVFWSYMLRLLPSMRTASGFIGLTISTIVGSVAIIAMSSWLNAAALAGSAAVEQHLENTVRDYQAALEQAHDIALSGQALGREVERARQSFEELAELEQSGDLSGTAGRGAVFRVLTQKAEELRNLEEQIAAQQEPIEEAFQQGNEILAKMRELTVAPGPVDRRSVQFSEESVKLAGVISRLNQYSVAPLVARAAEDLPSSVVLPELDGRSSDVRDAQSSTINSVLNALDQRSKTLKNAADEVLDMEPPIETAYNPISSADAVIKYAHNFVPSWAGAIAIDLLPAVLVFVLAITQAAIRSGKDGMSIEDTLTLSDLRAAMNAMKDVEATMGVADAAILNRATPQKDET